MKCIMKTTMHCLTLALLLLACRENSTDTGELISVEAKYVLPFPVGKAYSCSQAFNTSFSHFGTFKYSVDFDMSIGTFVTAARGGRVVYTVENYANDDHTVGHENIVIVLHNDSTYARYVHLTTNGALVEINRVVSAGDTIALSGSSGESNHPHLHFDVARTFTGRNDQTIPFDFMNKSPRDSGLKGGVVYQALPY